MTFPSLLILQADFPECNAGDFRWALGIFTFELARLEALFGGESVPPDVRPGALEPSVTLLVRCSRKKSVIVYVCNFDAN